MDRKRTSLLLPFVFLCFNISAISVQKLSSPDNKIRIECAADSLKGSQISPAYQVFYNDKVFLRPSLMGFEFAGQPVLTNCFKVTDIKTRENRNSWKPLYGEREIYPDNYNEMVITMQETIMPFRLLKVVFRAFNEGIAFRYEFPEQPLMEKFTIIREVTEFAFKDSTYVWQEYGHEGLYSKVLSSDIKINCELPLTILTADSIYAVIAEACNSDYPRAYVQPAGGRGRSNSIFIQLRGEAKGTNGYITAWRTITLADRPGVLIEQNYLILNLARPGEISDPSWIKPGKVIRDVTLSTIGSKKYIDYAQKQGIDYVILDWGWYGPPNAQTSDPSYVNVVNPGTGRPIPNHTGLNIPEIAEYGKSKGVGIFLYVNRQGLERYMDKFFPIYEAWGIKGIKPGFVNVGNQEWQQWIETMVKKAADHHLMVDIHDAYRPNGFNRTYPNLITQEGIHGNEQSPNSDHTTTLPFTRYTIGAADFTPGYCRSSLKNTWTHKLALPIVYYSPGMFLFWGEPLNEECHNRPELVLWHDMPVVWSDTKVLQGNIGEFIVVARRTGNNWYVGGITNHSERALNVKLDFLDQGKKYEAILFTDSPDAKLVIIEKKKVSSNTFLTFPLLASGGFAVQIIEK